MRKATPEFVLAKGLSVNTRIVVVAALAVIGITIQLCLSIAIGWVVVLASVLMGAAKWKTNEPKVHGKYEWKNVTSEEFREAEKLLQETRKAARGAGCLSSSSARGGCGCALMLLLVGAVSLVIGAIIDQNLVSVKAGPPLKGGSFGLLFFIDAVTLLVPIWLSGNVKPWDPPQMRLRMEQLAHIYNLAAASPKLEVQPSLQVRKSGDGTVPFDCRLMAKIKDADKNFMGIQVQVSINRVQSRAYPYTYCVIIAKPEFGLVDKGKALIETPPAGGFATGLFASSNEKKEARFSRFHNSLVELKKEGEVEIAVVRQNTRKNGYTTTPIQATTQFANALRLAEAMLEM